MQNHPLRSFWLYGVGLRLFCARDYLCASRLARMGFVYAHPPSWDKRTCSIVEQQYRLSYLVGVWEHGSGGLILTAPPWVVIIEVAMACDVMMIIHPNSTLADSGRWTNGEMTAVSQLVPQNPVCG